MSRQPSLLFRSLEPLIHALWPLFVLWSAGVAVLWCAGDSWIEGIPNPGLRAAAAFIIRSADAAWLLLAALNLYLDLAEREGIARARIISAVVFGVAIGIAWLSVSTGFPLGSVAYTSHLGLRLGPVPLGWPLLWLVVVLSGKALAARIRPHLSHASISLATGFLALLTDLNLEPLATKLRFYWFWYVAGTTTPATPSWSNYVTWGLAITAIAWFLRERNVAATQPQNTRPAFVIVIINAVFLIGHLRHLRGG